MNKNFRAVDRPLLPVLAAMATVACVLATVLVACPGAAQPATTILSPGETMIVPGTHDRDVHVHVSIRVQGEGLVRFMIVTAQQHAKWLVDPDDAQNDGDWIYNKPGTAALDRVIVAGPGTPFTTSFGETIHYWFINEGDAVVTFTYDIDDRDPPAIDGVPVMLALLALGAGVMLAVATTRQERGNAT